MATDGRPTAGAVMMALIEEGYAFEFHQAVRLLELLAVSMPVPDGTSSNGSAFARVAGVGQTSEVDREAIRFRSSVSLTFPASAIDRIERREDRSGPFDVWVNFMGLAGAGGPLPLPFTELVLDCVARRDTALRDFLDIFNHRLVSLLYRVRKLHRIGLDVHSPERTDVARYLYSIIGLGTDMLRGRISLPDRSLLRYAGLLAHHSRSMTGLERILSGYLQTTVRGRQLCGGWLRLGDDEQTAIGIDRRSARNNRLGRDVVLGGRYWDQQGRFEIEIETHDYTHFEDLLPGHEGCRMVASLVRHYAGEELDFDIVLLLDAGSASGLRLGSGAQADPQIERGSRLGWTSWLLHDGSRPSGQLRVRIPVTPEPTPFGSRTPE